MSGSSTGTAARSRKLNRQDSRHLQRRWIELIDEWHSTTTTSLSTRDSLVEQITHHAELLCSIIKDRSWLLDAFQLAINAVLFPENALKDDSEELNRVEQLGQQLLQLANRTVVLPHLQSLKERNAEPSQVEKVKTTLEEWMRLSRRLAVFERLRSLQQMLGLPPLPLPLVLEESTPSLLLCLASLPNGASVVAPLLRSFPWLVDESASVRLVILKQLLAGAQGRDQFAQLAEYGLLIGWKDGHEASIWSNPKQELSLEDLVQFYNGIIKGLRDSGTVEQAEALLDVLSTLSNGDDAQTLSTQLQPSKPTSSPPSTTTTHQLTPRFDLPTIQSLATHLSTHSDQNSKTHQHLASQLLSTHTTDQVVQRTIQLLDTHDNLTVRMFGLDIASRTSSAALLAALLYAKPPVNAFRLNLETPHILLQLAQTMLSQLQSSRTTSPQGGNSTLLSEALRSTLDLDRDTSVPACQIHLLSQRVDLSQISLHLHWLMAIKTLVEGQTVKPVALDMCWLAAYGGAQPQSGVEQLRAFRELVESFDAAHPAPIGRAALDQGLVRFRAGWDAFYHDCLALCGGGGGEEAPFAQVAREVAVEKLLSQLLRTGDVELFRKIGGEGDVSQTKVEEMVLDVSTSLFDQARVASTRSKDVRLSLEVLSALPAESARAKSQKDFIEAACRLSSFKIKSIINPGQLMEPKEIRATPDKMDLVARLLATQGDAHRSPELVLDVANRLCGIHSASSDKVSDKTLVEARTLAMLADASTAAEDFEDAASFCQRLVDRVGTVRSRVATSTSAAEIVEIAWKTCFQLSKHPLWEDTPSRISMLAHAMTLCPPTQLNAMLRQWQALDQQLVAEVETGKEFASTKKAAAAGGMGWLGAGPGGRGVGDYISAQTAASVGAGLVDTAANLLPLSFSPLSYFGSSATNTSTSSGTSAAPRATAAAAGGAGATTQEQEPKVDARTARLFDFDNVSGASSSGGYVDPTERAVRAARAARDFLGWKNGGGDGTQQQQQSGGSAMGGFSFSRGVGWLIGDGESR